MPFPTTFTEGGCPPVQTVLENLMETPYPNGRYGLTQVLASSLMPRTISQITNDVQGKYRKVKVITYARPVEGDVTQDVKENFDICSQGGNSNPPIEADYEVRYFVDYEFSMDSLDMATVCEMDAIQIARQLRIAFNALFGKMNRALINLQLNGVGNYKDGASSKNFTLLDAPNNLIFPMSAAAFIQEGRKVGMGGLPIWVGGNTSELYHEVTKGACCNLQGINIQQVNSNHYFWVDDQIEEEIATDAAFLISPYNTQLMEWFLFNAAGTKKNTDSLVKDTVIDPYTGLMADLYAYLDVKCDRWNFRLIKFFDLWQPPAARFKTGDPFLGTNGSLLGYLEAA